MGKLRAGVEDRRQIRQFEPKEYQLSYEMDLGDNNTQAEVKNTANNVKKHLEEIINEWFEEDFKKSK